MTHKSGEKADSESFVSELLATACVEFTKHGAPAGEDIRSWSSLVPDVEAVVTKEVLECDKGLSICKDDDDDDNSKGLSMLGATGRDAHFWSIGETGNSTPGSDDNL